MFTAPDWCPYCIYMSTTNYLPFACPPNGDRIAIKYEACGVLACRYGITLINKTHESAMNISPC